MINYLGTATNRPLVSIYMPTFNRVNLLMRAVSSVLCQSYENLELIIVDDCSSDSTATYLTMITKLDKRVRVKIGQINRGACACRNDAIDMAKGEYITGMDDDDIMLPDRIAQFVAEAYRLENNSFIVSRYRIRERGKKDAVPISRRFISGTYGFLDEITSGIAGGQIFTLTERLRKFHFDPAVKIWQDVDTWVRLLGRKGTFFVLPNDSYIIDTSHGGTRISSEKISYLEDSVAMISSKNNFNARESQALRCGLKYYGKSISHRDLIRRFFLRPRLHHLVWLLGELIRSTRTNKGPMRSDS
ncbi:hypothetical protein CDEF62S_00162 [Castellaniella defragrans]